MGASGQSGDVRSGRRWRRTLAVALLAWVAALGGANSLHAYEADQYSHRLVPLRDSREVLNRRVNDALREILAAWRGGPPRTMIEKWRFARRIYWRLGGLFWVHHLEAWAAKTPQIERLPQSRFHSIYDGSPLFPGPILKVFGVCHTIEIAGSLLGTDKLGHFFAQGVKYYGSYLLGLGESRILHRGEFNERWLFGEWTTGVYSNADIVADYEGYRFYRSLFEDGIVPGKPAIVGWRDGQPFLQRPFDWADHVNDYWDEEANPSFLAPGLQRFMSVRLPALCPDYWRNPQQWMPRDEAELERRYAGIGLRRALQNRMDNVCAAEAARLAFRAAP